MMDKQRDVFNENMEFELFSFLFFSSREMFCFKFFVPVFSS